MPAPEVIVDELTPPGHGRPAYLVRPRDPGTVRAAVLWLHWLGDERSDRSQYLAEAVEMAALGCVSLLPDGHFPWHADPDGTLADREAVGDQLHRVGAALRTLTSTAGVDSERLAVVGHDYGAMYTLAGRGFGARAVVAITPDTCWDNWFLTYWPHGEPGGGYAAAFDDVDPVAGAAACQDRLLLQWAQRDEYVGPDVAPAYAAAAPRARAASYRRRDHRLGGGAAMRDRREFLVERLGL
jgi:hypothetical protein